VCRVWKEKQMVDFNKKETLRQAIWDWHCYLHRDTQAESRGASDAWQVVEDAIRALDNAAYDRGQTREKYETGQLRMERDVARMARDELQRQFDERGRERDALQGRLQTQVPALRQLRDEAEAERDGFRGELELLHERLSAKSLRLRAALETLADRYHAQMCYKNQRYPHRRWSCPYVLAVQDANEALVGESVDASGGSVRLFPNTVVTVHRALTSEEVKEVGRALFNDCRPKEEPDCQKSWREGAKCPPFPPPTVKPKEQPEIEAVLMLGSELVCADGCGAIAQRGQCAYRLMEYGADAPLYASEACARKAGLCHE
jgi:hypothetical protein